MLANRKRKRPAETWGNATSPNWTFARHDGKNGAVFSSFFCIHATMFLPVDSELHLWIIWHFFWQQELGRNFKAPFPEKHDYQYLNTLLIFQKLLVLVRGCTGAGLSCCAFPRAPKERIQCVLHFILRELLGVTHFWWSLLPLTTNTGPVLVNNDKNTRALIHKLTLQSNVEIVVRYARLCALAIVPWFREAEQSS